MSESSIGLPDNPPTRSEPPIHINGEGQKEKDNIYSTEDDLRTITESLVDNNSLLRHPFRASGSPSHSATVSDRVENPVAD